MCASSVEGTYQSNKADTITLGYLAWFSLPLALTFLMMAGSAPMVSIGITWMHGASGERVHLSAFLLTFASCLFIYSPLFVSRNVAIRTITDRRSIWQFILVFWTCSAIAGVIILTISKIDIVGHWVFGTLLHTDLETEQLARQGMPLFIPIPFLVALRSLGHGCHISNNQSWHVGVGTGMRLVVMGLFVFGIGIHHNFTGPILGGLTYLSGIGTETIYMLVTLRGKPQWTTRKNGQALSYRQFIVYAGPLMIASLLTQIIYPMLIYMINTSRNPSENCATFNLVRDTAWVLFSMLNTIQPAIVAHATSRRNFRVILRFSLHLLVWISGITLLVALSPLREVIFIDWLKVDNEIIQKLTFTALLWMIPIPVINLGNLLITAMHTRSGRTIWVTSGQIVGLAVLGTIAISTDFSSMDGVLIALVGMIAFNLIATIVQTLGLFKGGLQAAISSAELVDHMNQRESDLPKPAVPAPERVQA